ncbi:MAG: hypothetical protein J4F41_00120 [Alphaproteobacteria bacterium]|nr:hypothetical protein [Alphaproteobacteria bacterium]
MARTTTRALSPAQKMLASAALVGGFLQEMGAAAPTALLPRPRHGGKSRHWQRNPGHQAWKRNRRSGRRA